MMSVLSEWQTPHGCRRLAELWIRLGVASLAWLAFLFAVSYWDNAQALLTFLGVIAPFWAFTDLLVPDE